MYPIGMAKRKKTTRRIAPAEIRAIRQRLGLTQTEAAEKVGVTLRAWQWWESGLKVPTASHQILIRLLSEQKI